MVALISTRRTCTRCEASKPPGEFYVVHRKNGRIEIRSRCKTCHREAGAEDYRKNKAARRTKIREWQKRNYQRIKGGIRRHDRGFKEERRAARSGNCLCGDVSLPRKKQCSRCLWLDGDGSAERKVILAMYSLGTPSTREAIALAAGYCDVRNTYQPLARLMARGRVREINHNAEWNDLGRGDVANEYALVDRSRNGRVESP